MKQSVLLGVVAVCGWQVAFAHPSIILGTDEYEFVYKVQLPKDSKNLRMWVPVAKSDAFQMVRVERSPSSLKKVQDRAYGNEILVADESSDVSGPVELRYKVRRKEKESYAASERDVAKYLMPERLVPTNQTFYTLASEAVKGRTTTLEKGRALYDHVLDRMKYDKSGTGWGRGDAVYACDAKTGNCTDFHAYFIALARSVGIPARFAIGFTIPAETNEGKIAGYHCWGEFYADGKWVPVDISEADKAPELADYYFGHHPANRFEVTKGRDLVVDPAPSASPINFLVYPLVEVDGKPVQAQTEFSFRRIKEAKQ
ncbi:MAG TPA: transglutaminase domain-containing protein [Candidatus Binatia bacterium]|nr:transglutaminase domain-containing protein [Candidatus Binatia bacterium]